MTDEEQIARAKRDGFGDKADLVKTKVVGSGISETTTVSLNLIDHPELLDRMPAPWTENPDMVVRLFDPVLKSSYKCPGSDRAQCCHVVAEQACTLPNWREREDPEWYAQRLNMYLSQVNRRIRDGGQLASALVADEAFELGQLFTEALNKFRWDAHAQSGKASSEGGKKGVERRIQGFLWRESDEATVAAVDALLAKGMQKKAAYSKEADRQQLKPDTIRKRYSQFKKIEKI